MTLRWASAATVELEEAVAWYDDQVNGLGDKLLAEVDVATRLIEQFPEAWNPLSKRTRAYRLNRFPYSLIYTMAATHDIFIVAVAHQHRKPQYWKSRT